MRFLGYNATEMCWRPELRPDPAGGGAYSVSPDPLAGCEGPHRGGKGKGGQASGNGEWTGGRTHTHVRLMET